MTCIYIHKRFASIPVYPFREGGSDMGRAGASRVGLGTDIDQRYTGLPDFTCLQGEVLGSHYHRLI